MFVKLRDAFYSRKNHENTSTGMSSLGFGEEYVLSVLGGDWDEGNLKKYIQWQRKYLGLVADVRSLRLLQVSHLYLAIFYINVICC